MHCWFIKEFTESNNFAKKNQTHKIKIFHELVVGKLQMLMGLNGAMLDISFYMCKTYRIYQNFCLWLSEKSNIFLARIFFKKSNAAEVAKILGVPIRIILDIGTMWTTLASGMPVDAEKFDIFCKNFKDYFNQSSVRWYHFREELNWCKNIFHSKVL